MVGFVDEYIGYEPAKRVSLKGIHVYMYMLCGSAHLCHKVEKEFVSGAYHLEAVVLERQGEILIYEKVYDISMSVADFQILLLHKLEHRPLGQLIKATLADHALPAGVNPKKEI